MIHNIITDKNGDEHQTVESKGFACSKCSLRPHKCEDIPESECLSSERDDGITCIYKRRIKIGDVKR